MNDYAEDLGPDTLCQAAAPCWQLYPLLTLILRISKSTRPVDVAKHCQRLGSGGSGLGTLSTLPAAWPQTGLVRGCAVFNLTRDLCTSTYVSVPSH